MAQETLDSLVQVIFTLPIEDREYVISRVQNNIEREEEEMWSGLSVSEREAVESYLVQRAESAVQRMEAGHYLTHEQAMEQMNQYVAGKTRVAV